MSSNAYLQGSQSTKQWAQWHKSALCPRPLLNLLCLSCVPTCSLLIVSALSCPVRSVLRSPSARFASVRQHSLLPQTPRDTRQIPLSGYRSLSKSPGLRRLHLPSATARRRVAFLFGPPRRSVAHSPIVAGPIQPVIILFRSSNAFCLASIRPRDFPQQQRRRPQFISSSALSTPSSATAGLNN